MEKRRARGMTVEGVNGKWRCRIMGGWEVGMKQINMRTRPRR
jgi:hypothetical protein